MRGTRPSCPVPDTKPLFDEAVRLGVGFELGFAELTPEGRRFNTAVLVGPDGTEVGRYRKIHLPGHGEHEPWRPFQHLEKRYFEVGDLGFPTFDLALSGRGQGRDADLQRPAMAGGLPRARPAGRRAHLRRVQHAGPQPAGARARPVRRLPQPPRHAGRRLPERHVRGGRRQGRLRGGRRPHRRLVRDPPLGVDPGPVRRPRRRGGRRRVRPRRAPCRTRRRCSTSAATANPTSTAPSSSDRSRVGRAADDLLEQSGVGDALGGEHEGGGAGRDRERRRRATPPSSTRAPRPAAAHSPTSRPAAAIDRMASRHRSSSIVTTASNPAVITGRASIDASPQLSPAMIDRWGPGTSTTWPGLDGGEAAGGRSRARRPAGTARLRAPDRRAGASRPRHRTHRRRGARRRCRSSPTRRRRRAARRARRRSSSTPR